MDERELEVLAKLLADDERVFYVPGPRHEPKEIERVGKIRLTDGAYPAIYIKEIGACDARIPEFILSDFCTLKPLK